MSTESATSLQRPGVADDPNSRVAGMLRFAPCRKGVHWALKSMACVVLALAPEVALGQSTPRIVVDVEPTVRVVSERDSSARVELSPVERAKNRITVVELDGKFYWASREYCELIRFQSGLFVVFADPSGSGLVKVLDQRSVPQSALSRIPGPDLQILEVTHVFLATISYWGSGGRVALSVER
jgi:hypothetical protein